MSSYKALYRKYRPKNFAQIKGQDHIVTSLKNILNFEKLSHAYLFSGPRGTGKTSVAKIFAGTLNCEHEKEKSKICDVCVNNLDNNLDIIEIDAASNNGIDEIRDLREKVKYSPSQYKYKVYIIDEVHMLTKAAFNALLKTLEEPPQHAVFILATTDPQKIPLTVISRVQRFNFKRITIPILERQLKEILHKENILIDSKALSLIAQMAEGGLRDALSIADQISIYSNNNITEKEINEVFSLASIEEQIKLINLIYKKNTATTLKIVAKFIESGIDIEKLIINLIDIIRDYIVYNKTHEEKLLEYLNEKEVGKLSIDIDFAYQTKDILLPLLNDLKYNEIPARSFEIIILQLLHSTEREEIIEKEEDEKEWSEFFKNEDTQPIELKEKNTLEKTNEANISNIKNENNFKFSVPEEELDLNETTTENLEIKNQNDSKFLDKSEEENQDLESNSKNSETLIIENALKKAVEYDFDISDKEKTNTDEILEEVTQSINLENEFINEQEKINESILSTDTLDLTDVLIDTGEIELSESLREKKDFLQKEDEEEQFFSFDNSKEEFSNPLEENNFPKEENSTVVEILKRKNTEEIFKTDSVNKETTDVEEFDITDLLKERTNLTTLIKEKEVVNLFFQIDQDVFNKYKEIWETIYSFKTDEKFSKEALYLEKSLLIAANKNFVLVSSKDDELIKKLNHMAKDNNFNLFIETLTGSPKHFFAITKNIFKKSKKMWKNILDLGEDFDIVKLPELVSYDDSKTKTEEFAKRIFGDSLEIKK